MVCFFFYSVFYTEKPCTVYMYIPCIWRVHNFIIVTQCYHNGTFVTHLQVKMLTYQRSTSKQTWAITYIDQFSMLWINDKIIIIAIYDIPVNPFPFTFADGSTKFTRMDWQWWTSTSICWHFLMNHCHLISNKSCDWLFLKLGNIWWYFPNACCEKYLKDNKNSSLHLALKICSDIFPNGH